MSNPGSPAIGIFTLRAQHLQFPVVRSRNDCLARMKKFVQKEELNTFPVNDEITRFHLTRHFWLNTQIELYGHLQTVDEDQTEVVLISRIPGTTFAIWGLYFLLILAVPFLLPTFFSRFSGPPDGFFLWPCAFWLITVGGNIGQVLLTRASLSNALISALQGK
jgi:hypothetical protein